MESCSGLEPDQKAHVAMLRIQDVTVDYDPRSGINCTAIILRKPLSSQTWEYFGTVETSDVKQIQGLQDWLRGGSDISESLFFGEAKG